MPRRNRPFENLLSKKFFARKEVLRFRRLKPMQPYPFFFFRSARDKGPFSAQTLAPTCLFSAFQERFS
jgi:hypothetical protein